MTAPLRLGGRSLDGFTVMAVINRTPDSFVDRGATYGFDAAHDFGKNTWHALEATRRLDELTATGWPVLVAVSNKDFIGETLGEPVDKRGVGTMAVLGVSAWLGARVFRVHDVAAARRALDAVAAQRGVDSRCRAR